MLAYRFAQAALLIRDDQRNALESATFPPVEGLAPGGKAVAQPNAENLALAIAAQSADDLRRTHQNAIILPTPDKQRIDKNEGIL